MGAAGRRNDGRRGQRRLGVAGALALLALAALTPVATAAAAAAPGPGGPILNGQCADTDCFPPALQVTKYLQKADGTTVVAGTSDPWQFTATVSPTPIDFTTPAGPGPSAVDTTDANGQASFEWEQDGIDSTVDLVETPQAGWVYNGAVCVADGEQTLFDTVGQNTPGSEGATDDLQGIPVGVESVVACSVYNRELQPATISVTKQTSPSGLPDAFSFDLSQGQSVVDTVTGVTDGQTSAFTPVLPGTYSVTEQSADGFDPANATCDNTDTQAVEDVGAGELTVAEGEHWNCTFVNTQQTGTITIVKQTQGVDGTFDFTTDLPGHSTVEITTSGLSGTSDTFTVPVGTYSISEDDPSPWTTSDAYCSNEDDPSAVTVRSQSTITCTFVNTPPDPAISITKTPNPTTISEPGGSVTYTVEVTNESLGSVYPYSLVDSVEGGTPFDVTQVAGPVTATDCDSLLSTELTASGPGQSATCSFTLAVTGNGGDTVHDTVTVEADAYDESTVSDSADASVDITSVDPTMTITKTPSVASIAEPGGPITYTVGITNTGVEPIVLDTFSDSIEGGSAIDVTQVAGVVTATDCDTLVGTSVAANGGTTSCQFTVDQAADLSDFPDHTIDDTVTVEAHDDDAKVSSQADASVQVTDTLPTLSVTKTADPSSVAETAPGDEQKIEYSVTVENTSDEDLTIDSLTDAVGGGSAFAPGGTCDALVGTPLAAHAQTSCTFTLGVSGNAGDTVDDVVTVAGSDNEGNQASAFDPASVTFTDVPSSIAVTKDAGVSSVPEPGGDVTYTVGITNTSATDVVTLDSIVDSIDGGSPFAAGGTCADLLGTTLDPGAHTSCTFSAAVSGNAGDTVPDTVTVSGTDDDQQPVSDEASASVGITNVAPTLTVTKTPSVDSVPEPGADVTYTLEITNTSPSDPVTLDSITDSVDGGTAFDVAGTCDDLIGTTLAADGGSASCAFTEAVTGHGGDVVADTVTVTGTDDDVVGGDRVLGGTQVIATADASVSVTAVASTSTTTTTTAPTTTTTSTPPPTNVGDTTLVRTGADTRPLVVLALSSLGLGVLALVGRRGRRMRRS